MLLCEALTVCGSTTVFYFSLFMCVHVGCSSELLEKLVFVLFFFHLIGNYRPDVCSYTDSNITYIHICLLSFFLAFMSLRLVNRRQLPRLSDCWYQFSELVQSAFPHTSRACGERLPNSSSRGGPHRGQLTLSGSPTERKFSLCYRSPILLQYVLYATSVRFVKYRLNVSIYHRLLKTRGLSTSFPPSNVASELILFKDPEAVLILPFISTEVGIH